MPAGGRHARVEPATARPAAWFFSLRAAPPRSPALASAARRAVAAGLLLALAVLLPLAGAGAEPRDES